MKIETEPPDPLDWVPTYVARRELGLDQHVDLYPDSTLIRVPMPEVRKKQFDGVEYSYCEDVRRWRDAREYAMGMAFAAVYETLTNGLEEFARDYNAENPNSMFRFEVSCSPPPPLPPPPVQPTAPPSERDRRRRRRRRPTDLRTDFDADPSADG